MMPIPILHMETKAKNNCFSNMMNSQKSAESQIQPMEVDQEDKNKRHWTKMTFWVRSLILRSLLLTFVRLLFYHLANNKIKKLKTEQQKLESLYKKYKEQQNDVFTAERIISKNDFRSLGILLNWHLGGNDQRLAQNDFPIISEHNLLSEIEKVKKMLLNKLKSSQPTSLPKRAASNFCLISTAKVKPANLVWKSWKMMLNKNERN